VFKDYCKMQLSASTRESEENDDIMKNLSGVT
jgi:hypothetical protein